MQKRELREANFKKFLTVKPRAISASPDRLIETSYLQAGQTLPLVLRANLERLNLLVWAATNKQLIEEQLLEHGAILFRDFELDSIDEFEEFIRTVSGELLEYAEPSSPRTEVGRRIYTSTEYPASEWIQLHNEMSYSHNWPRKVFFYCVKPAEQGGATPLASSARVYKLLDQKLRERFIKRRVMYVRNYSDELDLPWQHVFQTSDSIEVEDYCRRADMECIWHSDNRLTTRQVRQSVIEHPERRETLWFNQVHAFHFSTLSTEVRDFLLASMSELKIPRNAFYGDGTPIEASIVEEIRNVYRECSVTFEWQQGDVLMLDNLQVAHGRAPFHGARRILVGMSELTGSRTTMDF